MNLFGPGESWGLFFYGGEKLLTADSAKKIRKRALRRAKSLRMTELFGVPWVSLRIFFALFAVKNCCFSLALKISTRRRESRKL
jgi:hypothetical protein